jgi:hypothetical protein
MSYSNAQNLSGHLDDRRAAIVGAGFVADLGVPHGGWRKDEKEVAEDVFPAQLLAAYETFQWFFTALEKRVWVHLAAEMQAGKTGVVTALVRLLLSNWERLSITSDRIFVLTGMNDNSWRTQTKRRLPHAVRENVHHNGGISKMCAQLESLRGEDHLSNLLIVVDESHIAHSKTNKPSEIYKKVMDLCPIHLWQERNIRFLTISATDPSKVLAQSAAEDPHVCKTVCLTTDAAYQSVDSLYQEGRIRFVEDFGNLTTTTGLAELKRAVKEEFDDAPKYHLLRTPHKKQSVLQAQLTATFPGADVICFDAVSKPTVSAEDGSSASMEDINELLETPPEKHTFILLKNMFYAAKTMCDKHVGILWDRASSKDDTNLQSLLGRACGYGKSDRTIVYTSRQTVQNYMECWKELCKNVKEARRIVASLSDKDLTALPKRMPNLKRKGTGVLSTGVEPVPKSAAALAAAEAKQAPSPASKPIEHFVLATPPTAKSAKAVFAAIKAANPSFDETKYAGYKIHCWNVDTAVKQAKWRIATMMETGAVSSRTNITEEELGQDVLMIYLQDKNIILQPWNGKAQKANPKIKISLKKNLGASASS